MDSKSKATERTTWCPRLSEGIHRKSLGLVDALEADIRAGRVGAGTRLPPQRAIADMLGVDLTTVTRAFNEARRRGLIDAKAGRGTFVRRLSDRDGIDLQAPPAVDLSLNIPPQPSAARLQQLIPGTIAELLASELGRLHLHYQESAGSAPDRAAGSVWLSDRIPRVNPSLVLLASGAQSALFAVCECLLKPGDAIAAGFVTYPGLAAVAEQRGYHLDPIAMDRDGIVPDAFEAICRRSAPKAIYLIPAIDNPTTSTLPESRRIAIVEIARRYGVAIIEDDPYSSLLIDPPPSFAQLAPDLTWHIETISKCATPALRIAYIVAPGEAQAMRLAIILRAMVLMAPPLNAAVVSRWITLGILDNIRNAIMNEAAARQKLAQSLFQGFEFSANLHGHHIWLAMPPRWRAADLADHAARAGVTIVPSSDFAISSRIPEAVRISLGVAADKATLAPALKRFAGLLALPALPSKAIV